MTESEIATHEKLTRDSQPSVVALDDFYDEYGPEMTHGLLAALIQHKERRDMGGVPVQ
jgi:hypothetical protein